jgi:hypothetical protein
VREPRDRTLDGQVLVVDPEGSHRVRFVVTRVTVSPERPPGLDYSLTLHGPDGERLVGFDNAHPVARQKRSHDNHAGTPALECRRVPYTGRSRLSAWLIAG